jgi:coniferyl-aldehyde dehydrogenase
MSNPFRYFNSSPEVVSANVAILHVVQRDLSFGGVGPSVMGHYQGREGFETFSKPRPVFEESGISAVQTFMQPP